MEKKLTEQENRLTNDEKARVFALYWNQKVYGDLQDDPENCSFGEAQIDYDNFEFCVNENMKLLLISLSNISEPDAVWITVIYNKFMEGSTWREKVIFGRHLIKSGKYLDTWQIREYLRIKHYAVPLWFGIDHWANGKTALELSLAIETPSTDKS